jgi:hypothetical protein
MALELLSDGPASSVKLKDTKEYWKKHRVHWRYPKRRINGCCIGGMFMDMKGIRER